MRNPVPWLVVARSTRPCRPLPVTVAADYYWAIGQIEVRMALIEGASNPPTGGQLLALVDALRNGTLNEDQRETVQALRVGILALVERTASF